jgi:hypothetical protein
MQQIRRLAQIGYGLIMTQNRDDSVLALLCKV